MAHTCTCGPSREVLHAPAPTSRAPPADEPNSRRHVCDVTPKTPVAHCLQRYAPATRSRDPGQFSGQPAGYFEAIPGRSSAASAGQFMGTAARAQTAVPRMTARATGTSSTSLGGLAHWRLGMTPYCASKFAVRGLSDSCGLNSSPTTLSSRSCVPRYRHADARGGGRAHAA